MDTSAPSLQLGKQLTLRALLSGLLIGALLAPCNIYSGLKIGWSFNMSIIALLLAFGFWRLSQRLFSTPSFSMGESNINQTAASSTASVVSGGLVAPIPALAMLTGEQLELLPLTLWVFTVSFLGIWIAWYVREYLIVTSKLTFPTGKATVETMQDIFSHGQQAIRKVVALLGTLSLAAAVKGLDLWLNIPRWAPALKLQLVGTGSVSLKNLGFYFEPSMLMLGFGAIIGFRAGISLLIGAFVAWALLAPLGLSMGFMLPGERSLDAIWFSDLVEWLLWPGVALMVSYTLTSFAFRLARLVHPVPAPDSHSAKVSDSYRLTRFIGLAAAAALAVYAQIEIFAIPTLMAILAVPIAGLLAMVAAQVVGETGIPPIGAIGKVSQLSFGILSPGQITTNLISANVAGGAAGQATDLLDDMKVGYLIHASLTRQIVAQAMGLVLGSLVGAWTYLTLIPNPRQQLITEEWPAPAVATWKIVAETLQVGLSAVPSSALIASTVTLLLGISLASLERLYPSWAPRYLPSANAMGLAMVIPASLSLTMFGGALLAKLSTVYVKDWASRYVIVIAAGLIAGESVAGVFSSLFSLLAQ
jgi:uncharacterized oligopeptide transporter (OPT) family protein